MSSQDLQRRVAAALRELPPNLPLDPDLHQRVAARARLRRRRTRIATTGGAAAVTAAAAVLVTAGPWQSGQPDRWHPAASAPGAVTTLLGRVNQRTRDDACSAFTGAVAAAPDGTVYLAEATCVLPAGADEPGRSHPTTARPYRLRALHPDGRITDLWPAVVNGQHLAGPVGAMAVGADGTLYLDYAQDGHRLLARSPAGRWRWLTAAPYCLPDRSHSCTTTYTPAGSPARAARLEGVASIAIGPDQSIYLAEQHTVLRISPDHRIRLVAGTTRGNRLDSREPPAPTSPVKATSIPMPPIQSVAVTETGSLWIATVNRIYLADQTGTLQLMAQRGHQPQGSLCCLPTATRRAIPLPDGRTVTPVTQLTALAAAPQGGLYLLNANPNTVLHLDTAAGSITQVASLPSALGNRPVALTRDGQNLLVTLGDALLAVGARD